jgi:tripartite-type tricarboxylate transporter receptor subunit TctC
VENRAGADTAIGTEAAARAAPDGYTLLLVTTTQVVNMSLKERVGYDLRTDFEPVMRVAEFPLVLVVSAKSSIHSVADLVALAKSSPTGVTFVSGGAGTTGHLAGELFKQSTGSRPSMFRTRERPPAVPDLMAGRTDFFFSTIAAVQEMAKVGHLRMLAVTMNRRVSVPAQCSDHAGAGVRRLRHVRMVWLHGACEDA